MTARPRSKRPSRARAAPLSMGLDRDEIAELIQQFADSYAEVLESKTTVLAAADPASLDAALQSLLERLVSFAHPCSSFCVFIALFIFIAWPPGLVVSYVLRTAGCRLGTQFLR